MKSFPHLVFSLLLFQILSWNGSESRGQQSMNGANPSSVSEYEVLQLIGQLELGEQKASQGLPVLERQLAILIQEFEIHDEKELGVLRIMKEFESKALNLSDESKSITDEVEKETSCPLVDRETSALLARNCLLELQRIRWDMISEQSQPEPKAKKAQLENAKAKVRVVEAELQSIHSNLESLKKKTSDKDGDKDVIFREQSAKLARAEAQLVEATSRLEELNDDSVSSSAAKVEQMMVRSDKIKMELDQLALQKKAWDLVEAKQHQISIAKELISSLNKVVIDGRIEQNRRELIMSRIRHALEKYRNKESSKSSDQEK